MAIPPERQYHVSQRGRKFGPFTLAQLTTRHLEQNMLVWYEGLPEWLPVTALEELRPYVRQAAPTRTTAPPSAANESTPSLGRGPPSPGRSRHVKPAGQPQPLMPAQSVAPWVANPEQSSRARRSPSGIAKTIGILSIVFGTLGLVCCPFSIFGHIASDSSGVPEVNAVVGQPHVFGVRLILYVFWLIVSIPDLLAGIGLVKAKAWGRMLAMVVSITCLTTYVISFLFECTMVNLPLLQLGGIAESDETIGIAVIAIFMQAIGSVVALIYHAVVLILLNRKSVKESLA